KRVDRDVPKVDFPASLMIFRYCSDGVKYNVLAGDPFREAHERLVATDGKYREAIKHATAGLDGVTASDAGLTLQFRQALLEAGIDKLIEAEASKGRKERCSNSGEPESQRAREPESQRAGAG